jgi:hypothetical protein
MARSARGLGAQACSLLLLTIGGRAGFVAAEGCYQWGSTLARSSTASIVDGLATDVSID